MYSICFVTKTGCNKNISRENEGRIPNGSHMSGTCYEKTFSVCVVFLCGGGGGVIERRRKFLPQNKQQAWKFDYLKRWQNVVCFRAESFYLHSKAFEWRDDRTVVENLSKAAAPFSAHELNTFYLYINIYVPMWHSFYLLIGGGGQTTRWLIPR